MASGSMLDVVTRLQSGGMAIGSGSGLGLHDYDHHSGGGDHEHVHERGLVEYNPSVRRDVTIGVGAEDGGIGSAGAAAGMPVGGGAGAGAGVGLLTGHSSADPLLGNGSANGGLLAGNGLGNGSSSAGGANGMHKHAGSSDAKGSGGDGGASKDRRHHRCRALAMGLLDGLVKVVDVGIQLLGPVLAALASSLFTFIIYVYCKPHS
jgi:hypothetical protein